MLILNNGLNFKKIIWHYFAKPQGFIPWGGGIKSIGEEWLAVMRGREYQRLLGRIKRGKTERN